MAQSQLNAFSQLTLSQFELNREFWIENAGIYKEATQATQVLSAEENAAFLLGERMREEVETDVTDFFGLAGEYLKAAVNATQFDLLALHYLRLFDERTKG